MNKRLIWINILFIVLILIWGLNWYLTKHPLKQAQFENRYNYHIDTDLDTIEIQQQNAQLILQKSESNQWQVNQHPVDIKRLERSISSLNLFSKKNLVSTNPAKYMLFEVTTSNLQVTLRQKEKTVLSFIIGKTGPTFGTQYIRILPDENVYLINTSLSSQFIPTDSVWIDKTTTANTGDHE